MKNIAAAIIKVMQEVKGIEKSMTVGTGNSSYKGVADQEVKKVVGEAMAKNGLCILPTKITPTTKIERWEQDYNGQKQVKQSVFTDVITEYLLLHESGESITVSGYGHGIDSQDKGAGKATTYALKYVLLYMFLVPTGKIDDADAHHSDAIETPVQRAQQPQETKQNDDNRPWLSEKAFNQALERIKAGEVDVFEKTANAFKMKKEYREQLKTAAGK